MRWLMIDLRPIDKSGIPALIELWKAAGLPTRPTGRDHPDHIAREMTDNPDQWIGAWDGTRLVGMVLVTDDGRKGWLNRLTVHPDYRGQGIARRLVEAGEVLLHSRGREVLAILIEDYNTRSMEIFTHLGYVREDHILYYTKRKRPEA